MKFARSIPLLLVALGLLVVASAQAAPPGSDSVSVSEASVCTISQDCWDGSTVSCSGSPGTCTSGSTWVECDGTRHSCPSSACDAQITCSYGGIISCTGNYYCEEGSDYVYCQGTGTLNCDDCFPAIWCWIP